MSSTGPILALVQIPPSLRARVEGPLSRVWSGRFSAVEAVEDGPDAPTLSVVAGSEDDVLRIARAHDARAPGAVFVAVTDAARKIRGRRGAMPRNVAWAMAHDELEDLRLLGVTMRYALEVAARRRVERRLASMSALAEVGTIAAATAHEIGSPLTSLLTNLELLWSQSEASADRGATHGALTDALEAARHVARVTEDLGRATSRAGRLASVDVSAVLGTALRLAARSTRGVMVRVGGMRGCVVRADETRLCQVFLNVVRNAAQAAQEGGGHVDVEVGRAGDSVWVQIRDDGPGLADEVAARLFEPWQTGRPTGTGLGLALCRQYLGEMGGSIEHVRGAPSTTFEIRLGSSRLASVPPTLVPDNGTGRTAVLVVDDDALVGRAFQRVLGSAHRVDIVATAADAERRLTESWYDVVFVDLHLGGDSGRSLHERIEARSPDQARQIVFVSGGFEESDLAYLEARAIGWIRKPFGAVELRTLVAERANRA